MVLFIILAYILIALITYGKLPFTFFQQDEWAIFSNFIYWDKAHLDWLQRLFTHSQKTHLIPLANLVSYFQFKFFGLNFFPYGVSAILIHLVNSFLVYYLTFLLLRKRLLAFLAGLLFLTNSISHQGFTWIATTNGTALSAFFILLSIVFFTKYIKEAGKIQHGFLSLIFFTISLLFKETSIFLFLFYPVFYFLYKESKNLLIAIKFFIPFFTFGFLYVVFRAYFLIAGFTNTTASAAYSQPDILVYIYRIFTSPLKFIAQNILSQELIIKIADSLITLAYPRYPNFLVDGLPNPYISQSVGADTISYVLSILIIFISIAIGFYFRMKKENYMRKVLFLSIAFISLSSFPFIFIPGSAGYFSLIEGRHLYMSSIFSSVLLVVLGYGFYSIFKRKRIIALVLIAVYAVFLSFHINKIRGDMNYQVGSAFIRKSIVNKIYDSYPSLPKKSAFYIEGDKPYYGLPNGENIIPFQSGFGQTLLVWYNEHGQTFPLCFFKDRFFYDLLNQGYRECEGRGFGYFRKIKDLTLAIEKDQFLPSDVIAFRYNSDRQLLVDITKSTRAELKK